MTEVLALALSALVGSAAPGAPDAPDAPVLVVLDVVGDVDPARADALSTRVRGRAQRFPLTLEVGRASCDVSTEACLLEAGGPAAYVLAARAGTVASQRVVSLSWFDVAAKEVTARGVVEAWSDEELDEKLAGAVDALVAAGSGLAPSAPPVPTDGAPANAPDAGRASTGALPTAGLPLGLLAGGIGGAVVGAALVGLGALPSLDYAARKDELGRLTRSFDGSDEALAAAHEVHEDALAARKAHNDVGRWVMLGGVLLVIAGGAAAGASFALPVEGGP